jgi:hypothetical protein
MKHLRGFNEDVSEDDYVELKDFCESSLAYLLDDYNYDLTVRRRTYGDPPKSDVVVSIGPMRGVESRDLVYFKISEGADLDVAFKEFKLDDVIDDKITLASALSVSIKVSSKKI